MDVAGLDIGGANLKAAHTREHALTSPFALWKSPGNLTERLQHLLQQLPPFDRLAVTMTGELCDCFPSKREGVKAILKSVAAATNQPVEVWSHLGFVSVEDAGDRPLIVASANWHALATYAARFCEGQPGLLIDVGSTTTDLVPIVDGKPCPRGWTDPERLRAGELLYTGARRTPVCAILGPAVAAEFFATMHDVYLVLGEVAEDANDRDTADGRAATREMAVARLARMLCGDRETIQRAEVEELARRAKEVQLNHLAQAIRDIIEPLSPRIILLAGSGTFVAEQALKMAKVACQQRRLQDILSTTIASAACAYAVARLAQEKWTRGER